MEEKKLKYGLSRMEKALHLIREISTKGTAYGKGGKLR
jgi:hypothetical protein